MKKTLLVASLLMATSAFAADIEIYGRVDGGLRYTHEMGGGITPLKHIVATEELVAGV